MTCWTGDQYLDTIDMACFDQLLEVYYWPADEVEVETWCRELERRWVPGLPSEPDEEQLRPAAVKLLDLPIEGKLRAEMVNKIRKIDSLTREARANEYLYFSAFTRALTRAFVGGDRYSGWGRFIAWQAAAMYAMKDGESKRFAEKYEPRLPLPSAAPVTRELRGQDAET